MEKILIVGAGGFLGATLRYLTLLGVGQLLPHVHFPLGTLVVNVLGCAALGTLAGLADGRMAISPEMRLFLGMGLLGSFTTFSTLGYESFALARDGQVWSSGASLALHVGLGLFAVWASYDFATRV